MDDLLRARELAQKLQVNTETVRRWTRDGIIPHVRIGASKRYNLSKVLSALEAPTK